MMQIFFCLDIFLTGISKKIPFHEIKPRILSMDPYFDDEQILSNLLKFAPTKDEQNKLTPYMECDPTDLHGLSLPDQFGLQVKFIWQWLKNACKLKQWE